MHRLFLLQIEIPDFRNLVDLFKIAESRGFISRIPQKGGRVEGCHDQASVIPEQFTMLLCDLEVGVDQTFCGDPSETQDQFRVDQFDL